jgi:hypothetical protein
VRAEDWKWDGSRTDLNNVGAAVEDVKGGTLDDSEVAGKGEGLGHLFL